MCLTQLVQELKLKDYNLEDTGTTIIDFSYELYSQYSENKEFNIQAVSKS